MRDYDPTTGRYTEADPLGLVDGASVYGYALQNAGRWTDPRGECVGYFAAACVGALIGGGGDLLYQLYRNDWQFECVDWWEVAGFAALGAGLGVYARAVLAVDAAAVASAAGTGAGVGGAGVGVGLATRGARPAPGTRVVPEGVPGNWRIKGTNTPGGVQYYNPQNPNMNVRVMQGNPTSPYPNSRGPYARQQDAAGTYLRQDGTPSSLPRGGRNDPDAHIPLNQFKVR
jgi:uncharacterized protein RhaS with RHS repeats